MEVSNTDKWYKPVSSQKALVPAPLWRVAALLGGSHVHLQMHVAAVSAEHSIIIILNNGESQLHAWTEGHWGVLLQILQYLGIWCCEHLEHKTIPASPSLHHPQCHLMATVTAAVIHPVEFSGSNCLSRQMCPFQELHIFQPAGEFWYDLWKWSAAGVS